MKEKKYYKMTKIKRLEVKMTSDTGVTRFFERCKIEGELYQLIKARKSESQGHIGR